jgi:hypothetical protein
VAAQLLACTREERVLELETPTDLLERPYPMGYPSSAPKPNTILRTLSPQRVLILDDSLEKDFHVYRVRDSQGNEGYLIGRTPGMRELKVHPSAN